MGLGVSGKVPELSFEESAGFFLPGNIVGGGSWKILVGSFIPGKSCVWRGFKSRIKPVRGRPRDCGKWRFVQNIKPVGAQTVVATAGALVASGSSRLHECNYEALIFVKAQSPPSERTQRESERASEGECV